MINPAGDKNIIRFSAGKASKVTRTIPCIRPIPIPGLYSASALFFPGSLPLDGTHHNSLYKMLLDQRIQKQYRNRGYHDQGILKQRL